MDFVNHCFHYLAFFLDGLALNLTPAVFPALAITVFIFHQRAVGNRPAGAVKQALVFVLGMVAFYLALCGFVMISGTPLGTVLQSKWLKLFACILMLGLSLVMVGGLSDGAYGMGRVLAAGLSAGLWSFPWIGSTTTLLLASVASPPNPVLGMTSFLVFALGLATPCFILGAGSGFLHRFFQFGIIRGLGFLLLGFSLYFFMRVFNPEMVERIMGKMRASSQAALWDEYKPYKLAIAQEKGQPVVIDFYADWCVLCHELKDKVFSDARVSQELQQFVRLRVDATEMMADPVQQALTRFDIFGLPTIVFFDSLGQEVKAARIDGYVEPESFLKTLRMVLDKK